MKKNSELLVHKGPVVDVYSSEFEDHNGLFNAQVLKHSGAVCIAASNNQRGFFMVEQYRFGIEDSLLEFPAGKINEGEDLEIAAHRELQEETGYRANNLVYLGKIHPSPAFLSEVIHLYYAYDLDHVGQNLDSDEFLDLSIYDLEKLEAMIYDNSISDAKTIALIFKLKHFFNQ